MSRQLQKLIFDSSIPLSERVSEVFNYQTDHCKIYSGFTKVFGLRKMDFKQIPIEDIPLIPIRVFKEAKMKSFKGSAELIFKSSGTGKMSQSQHFVKDISIYNQAIELEFYRHFAKENTSLLCYTPGYSDSQNSSLIWMLNYLAENDPSKLSRFLPIGKPIKRSVIEQLKLSKREVILFGAAFGLLDLIDFNSVGLPDTFHVIETGGMKTHRREMNKTDLRKRLSDGFGLPLSQIHSEYGMCELLSQSYAIGGEWFTSPDWVHVTIRRASNPMEICEPGESGKIGIIDLANIHSCSFILTDDMGIMDESGNFKVLGRWENAEMRGCNFLIDSE